MKMRASDVRRFRHGTVTIVEFPGKSVFSALYDIPKHRRLVQNYLRRKYSSGVQFTFRYF